ncbi:hypothetical protein GCM10010472_26590 [Pseudonocardia halophobica]|uniref:O-antigen/teichoic acid export membrane protein n=1 Tax=Pseudonocardia halophobica TaxID=29401 RepID=A0A9W6KWE4_9PSEU|nr:lipopolysaccharide biosynthesis protein [Pseudonocardia halophobica]GLL08918.1 hypothetical protein GCM10017577_00580 [Pseudonocardia halophobica]
MPPVRAPEQPAAEGSGHDCGPVTDGRFRGVGPGTPGYPPGRVTPISDVPQVPARTSSAGRGRALTPTTRSRTRSLGLVGLGIIGSGLLVNGYLAIIARSLPAAEYAYFGAFWSIALVVGFGVFLPIEQETARLMQVPDRPGRVLHASLFTALLLAAAEVVVVLALSPVLVRAFGGEVWTIAALAVLCIASAGQFVMRGALIGMDRMDRHALVMLWDTVLRVALAGAVALLIADPDSSIFAWTLVLAILLAHGPQLLALARRRTRMGSVPDLGDATMTPRGVRRAVLPLLLGSLCAQLLLNGPPILVPLLARDLAQADMAGRFVAGYTLARIPLFLMVPLQTALLPVLTRLLHGGDRAVLRKVTLRLSAGLLALAVVAFGLGYAIGPWLVGLVFGQGYRLGAFDMALLSVGVAAYLGMVLVTQVLVASVRHSHVAWAWLSGVVVAVVTVLVVPDLLLSAELAFVLGSTVGWVVGTVLMLSRTRNRELTRV